MIYGIGTDLVELSRIVRLLEKYGKRFAKRLLTNGEWPEFMNSDKPAIFLAKHFAAKEAFSVSTDLWHGNGCVPRRTLPGSHWTCLTTGCLFLYRGRRFPGIGKGVKHR